MKKKNLKCAPCHCSAVCHLTIFSWTSGRTLFRTYGIEVAKESDGSGGTLPSAGSEGSEPRTLKVTLLFCLVPKIWLMKSFKNFTQNNVWSDIVSDLWHRSCEGIRWLWWHAAIRRIGRLLAAHTKGKVSILSGSQNPAKTTYLNSVPYLAHKNNFWSDIVPTHSSLVDYLAQVI